MRLYITEVEARFHEARYCKPWLEPENSKGSLPNSHFIQK
jgi:hypothetical protein